MSWKRVELDLGEYISYLQSPNNGYWKFEKKLPLTTDGQLRIIPLGVGAAFSSQMYQSNFIIIKGNDVLFVDLGSKTTLKLAEFGLTVLDIKDIMFTHSHADHVGSSEELALKWRYMAQFVFMNQLKKKDESVPDYIKRIRGEGVLRPRLHIPHLYMQQLWGWTLRAGLAFSEEIDVSGSAMELTPAHFFEVKNPRKLDGYGVDSWEFNVGSIRVQTFVVKHVPDSAKRVTEAMYSVGMIIDDRVYISGDTRFDETTTLRFGDHCELCLHDCQDFPAGVHANYDEVLTLPSRIRKKTLLYHLSDGMLGKDVKKDGFLGLLEPAPVVYDFFD
jgi:ribonuclease BN (tRNA processing enzyme)